MTITASTRPAWSQSVMHVDVLAPEIQERMMKIAQREIQRTKAPQFEVVASKNGEIARLTVDRAALYFFSHHTAGE